MWKPSQTGAENWAFLLTLDADDDAHVCQNHRESGYISSRCPYAWNTHNQMMATLT
jgi:hypothetical protein